MRTSRREIGKRSGDRQRRAVTCIAKLSMLKGPESHRVRCAVTPVSTQVPARLEGRPGTYALFKTRSARRSRFG